jgi:hypothetical protein
VACCSRVPACNSALGLKDKTRRLPCSSLIIANYISRYIYCHIGDSKTLDLTEEAGGVIVMEEFAEGIRLHRAGIKLNGDLMGAMADGYFTQRVPPAWF